jgi:hypothetical protein
MKVFLVYVMLSLLLGCDNCTKGHTENTLREALKICDSNGGIGSISDVFFTGRNYDIRISTRCKDGLRVEKSIKK